MYGWSLLTFLWKEFLLCGMFLVDTKMSGDETNILELLVDEMGRTLKLQVM